MTAATDPIARELEEKNKVIMHLTQTLAHTRECLEIARVALERIAAYEAADAPAEAHRGCRETALETLRQI